MNKVQKAELAQILNYCMGVAGGDALLRFCEDKISAVHGGDASDMLSWRHRSCSAER